MLLSAVSVLVVAQSSSEIPEGLMNNPVFQFFDVIGTLINLGSVYYAIHKLTQWEIMHSITAVVHSSMLF